MKLRSASCQLFMRFGSFEVYRDHPSLLLVPLNACAHKHSVRDILEIRLLRGLFVCGLTQSMLKYGPFLLFHTRPGNEHGVPSNLRTQAICRRHPLEARCGYACSYVIGPPAVLTQSRSIGSVGSAGTTGSIRGTSRLVDLLPARRPASSSLRWLQSGP